MRNVFRRLLAASTAATIGLSGLSASIEAAFAGAIDEITSRPAAINASNVTNLEFGLSFNAGAGFIDPYVAEVSVTNGTDTVFGSISGPVESPVYNGTVTVNAGTLPDGLYSITGSIRNPYVPGDEYFYEAISGNDWTILKDTVLPEFTSTGGVTVTTNSATLTGIVANDANYSAAVLKYGPGYGTSVSLTSSPIGGNSYEIAKTLTGLQPSTIYPYMVEVSDAAGNVSSFTGAFQTAFSWTNLYAGVSNGLTTAWIANNLNTVTEENVSGFSNLYFEYSTGGVTKGRISFSTALDLTNSGTQAFLQNLPNVFVATEGGVRLNASGSVFKETWAAITLYGLSPSLADETLGAGNFSVRDDDGTPLVASDVVSNVGKSCTAESCSVTFDAAHFTSFDFTPFLTDVTISADTGGSPTHSGSVVTVGFTGSSTLQNVSATIAGRPATVSGSGNVWSAYLTMLGTDPSGNVAFTIDFQDSNGNTGTTVTAVTDSTSVTHVGEIPSGLAFSTPSPTNSTGVTMNLSASGTVTYELTWPDLVQTYTETFTDSDTVDVVLTSGDGTKQAFVNYSNASGSVGSADASIVLDQTAPDAPSISTLPYSTNASSATSISGTAEAYTLVQVVKDGTGVCAPVAASSTGSFLVSDSLGCLSLGEGDNVFSAYATDAAGNVSGTGTSVTITRDTAAPSATVSYSTTDPTKEDVVATLGAFTKTGTTVTNNSGSESYTFSQNGSYAFEFSDAVGNTGSAVATVANIDKTAPDVAITSHTDGETLTGASVIVSGTASDDVELTDVSVNGSGVSNTGAWSFTLPLSAGSNAVTAIATDHVGNTGSVTISIVRVPFAHSSASSVNSAYSATVTFETDLTATGSIEYGTDSGSLSSAAETLSEGISHSIALTGLSANTEYFYRVRGTSLGNAGPATAIGSFKTLQDLPVTESGSVEVVGPAYISGSTSTGATFTQSGIVDFVSASSTGSFVTLPLNGLVIVASGAWDGVFHAPEITNFTASGAENGYSFIGNAFQIGSPVAGLALSGQVASVTIQIGAAYSGMVLGIYRSTDGGATYAPFTTCTVTPMGACTFESDHFSLFAPAMPTDSVPDAFTLTDVDNAELIAEYVSNAVTLTGFTAPASISVTGGEYRIGTGAFTAASGTVMPGDSVSVRLNSANAYSTTVSATLTLSGGISDTYSVTTKARSASSSGGGGGGGGGSWHSGVGTSVPNVQTGATLDLSKSGSEVKVTVTTSSGTSINTFRVPGLVLKSVRDIRFKDVSSNWAKGYVYRLVARGIVDNNETYRPEDSLTRAEFLKIVINSAGWQTPSEFSNVRFKDVDSDAWFAPYVSLAISKGMINDTNGAFRPNDSISRAEATKILLVALGTKMGTPSEKFNDVDHASDLSRYVETARELGIVSGQMIDGVMNFRPNDKISRAEIAKIVVKAFGL